MNSKTTIPVHCIDLNILSPFFFILSADNFIVDIGQSLHKLMSDIVGISFEDVFLINNQQSGYNSLLNTLNKPLEVKVANKNISFTGCFTHLADANELLFIGNPCINSSETINQLGLTINDFAPHDTINHTYRLINTDEKTNNEIKEIAEKQLIESRLLHKIIDMVPQQIFLKDKNARFLLVNKHMAQLFGAEIPDIIGKTDRDFWTNNEEIDFYTNTDMSVIESGLIYENYDEPTTMKNGEKRINHVVKMPFTLANDEKCVLGISIDITEIKKAEGKLKLYNEELENEIKKRTQELKDKNIELINYNNQLEEYAFTISHHVKAPVARLVGLSNIFNINTIDDPSNMVILPKIVETTKLLNEVINDLNRIIDIKKRENTLEQIDLLKIFKKLENNFKHNLESIDGILKAELGDVEPFYSDIEYLESIFSNLINNAIKFRSERKLHITISAHSENNKICFVVSDNGIGINMDLVKNKIFGLYQRFNQHIEGKGLGLNLVKQQVEALEGKIEVNSQIGDGTSFIIKLPLRSQPASFSLFKPVSLCT